MLPTLESTTNNLRLDEFLELLKKSDVVDGILLMGSSANGTMNKFSDIDITLIVKNIPANTLGIATFVEHRFTEIYIYTVDEINTLIDKNDIDPDKKEGWIFNWIRDGKIITDKSGSLSKVKEKSTTLNLDKVSDYLIFSSISKVNYNYVQNKRYFDSGSEIHLKALQVRLLYCMADVFVAYFNVRKLRWSGEKQAIKYLEQNDHEFLELFEGYQTATELKDKMELYQQIAELALDPAGGLWKREVVSVITDGNFSEESIRKSLEYWNNLLK
ncbi:MAG: nucleotidyltransferase domain-containing protein [Candidatus Daviesbacteria bacterium]